MLTGRQHAEMEAFVARAQARWSALQKPTLSTREGVLYASWGSSDSVNFWLGLRLEQGSPNVVVVDWSFWFCAGYYIGGQTKVIPDWALEFLFWFVQDRAEAARLRDPARPVVPPVEVQRADVGEDYLDRMHRQHAAMRGDPDAWEAAVRLGGRAAFEASAGLQIFAAREDPRRFAQLVLAGAL